MKTKKKRKRQKEERTSVPALYHGIFMLKSNVYTSIELDTIMCANWLIDWLLKVQQAIFQSYSGWEKFVSKKSERGDSGMGQHGQRHNTGIFFLSLPTTSWSYFNSPGFRRVTLLLSPSTTSAYIKSYDWSNCP
jgi:hypothetical protein